MSVSSKNGEQGEDMSNFTVFRKKRSRAVLAGLTVLSILVLSLSSTRTYAQFVAGGEGTYSSYAVGQNGNLYSWGKNTYGQLGIATTTNDSTPMAVPFPSGVTGWAKVYAGGSHVVAIGNDGNLYTWGLNTNGQLGNGTTTQSTSPIEITVPGVTSWKAVAAGDAMSFAIGSNDSLYSWGYNNFGQLGDGTTTQRTSPVTVQLPNGVLAKVVSAAGNSALAVGTDGNLYAWGRNINGQLGQGNTTDQKLPVIFPLPAGVAPVKPISGQYFNAVLASDGNIYASGSNGNGQLGDSTLTQRTSPVVVKRPNTVSRWETAACGASFILAIGDNDSLYAWGFNGTGELGVATGTNNNVFPINVALPGGVLPAAVAAGHNHGFVLSNDGNVYAWGRNVEGQVGNNSTTPTATAIPVTEVVGVGATGYLTLGTQPAVPELVSPANNATGQAVSLTLKWRSISGATNYRCQVSNDPSFSSSLVADNSSLTDTSLAVTGLSNLTTYYWRVRSYTNTLFSSYSTVDTFTTIQGLPPAPTLVAPASNATDLPNRDTLVCNSISGASGYNWQVSVTLGFSTFFLDDSTTDTTSVISGLLPGTKYYWRVRAINPTGAGDFAGPDSFTVLAAPPSPLLMSPASGATFVRADTLSLAWHAVPGASGYGFEVADTVSFARVFASVDSVKGNSDTSYVITRLSNLTKYYWRVRSYNAGGFGVYSAPDSFTTRIAVPDKPTIISPVMSATGVPRRTTFKWNVAARAEKYRLQVATDYHPDSTGAFISANVVFDTTLTSSKDTTLQLSAPLDSTRKYYWHIAGIDTAGTGTYSDGVFTTGTGILAVDEYDGIPTEFALLQNFPNPFNPSTLIRYDVPRTSQVTIKVYDMLGRVVATLVNARQTPGRYTVEFNGSRFASGVYFFRMSAGTFSKIQKMMLIK